MRTPLTDIIGYADLLVESTGEHAAAGTPDLSLAAGRIRESGLALLGMIDTVLDHASLEAGALPMQIEPVALAGVVDEVCIAARPRTRHRGNSLTRGRRRRRAGAGRPHAAQASAARACEPGQPRQATGSRSCCSCGRPRTAGSRCRCATTARG